MDIKIARILMLQVMCLDFITKNTKPEHIEHINDIGGSVAVS